MPGKTTSTTTAVSSSSEAVTVSKSSLDGAQEWDTCQDSPSNWSRERGDSMKSGSSKSGENGSVLSKSSVSTAEPGTAGPSGSGSSTTVETTKEEKEKDHMMKRTSSWMKNLGNGMRTLRLRKGSGKKKEKLDDSILDEDPNTSTKGEGEGEAEPTEEIPAISSPSPPSVSVTSSLRFTKKKKEKDKEKDKEKSKEKEKEKTKEKEEKKSKEKEEKKNKEKEDKKIKEKEKEKDKSKSKEKVKDKGNDKSNDNDTEAPAVTATLATVVIVPGPEPMPVPAPETKTASVVHVGKEKKRGKAEKATGQNGSAVKPSSGENPDKTDPARFIGEGLCFKAKLIGVLEVSGPRGDRICQEALSELKIAVKAAGEHKQKVTIHVALDGLRLRDEKTGDCLYHHQVHKISFIAQDLTDTRAFGYIFGSPDTGHRFFGIKTEKSASQVVMAMRDLFQVVFDLKKKEIERAKQQLEMQQKFLATRAAETAPRSGHKSDMMEGDLLNLEVELNSLQEGLENIHSNLGDSNTNNSLFNRGSTASISSDPMNPMSPGFKYSSITNNVNSNVTSGMNAHSTILPTNSNHSGHGNLSSFGDSFDPFDSNPNSAKWTSPFASDPFSQVDPFAQVDPFPTQKFSSLDSGSELFASDPFDTSVPDAAGISNFAESGTTKSSREGSTSWQSTHQIPGKLSMGSTTVSRKESTNSQPDIKQELSSTLKTNTNGPTSSTVTSGWMASFEDNFVPQPSAGSEFTNGPPQTSGRTSANLDIFTELDPLGTGRVRPFVDRKDFFHDLKNPPKKVLKELSTTVSQTSFEQNSGVSLPSPASTNQQQKVLYPGQEPTIHNSFSTHFNPSSTGSGALDFESHFKIAPKTELRTSTIRNRIPSSSGGDSPPNYSPPPPPPSSSSVSNSVYFINPPVAHIAPPISGGSRIKKSPGLLKHMTISNTPASLNPSNTSPKTLPRSVRLGKQFSTLDYTEEIPSLTPPPPPRPPPTLTRNSTSAVPRPHSGNENRRQNYATLSSISKLPPEPPPRPLQTTTISNISSSGFSATPLVSPPPPLPPKKQVIGPTLSSSTLGKLLYTSENSSAENDSRTSNDLPLPLPSRRNGNTNSTSSTSRYALPQENTSSTTNLPRYALPAENSISSPILYSRKKPQDAPPTENIPRTCPGHLVSIITMEQALNQVASMSLGQLATKLGLPVTQLSYLTINQLAEQLTIMDLRRNSDVGPIPESFESNFDPGIDDGNDQNDFSTASAPPVFDGSRDTTKPSNEFDKYAVFRELTLEDASGFSMCEEDVGGAKTLTTMTSRDSSSERTLQADGPEVDDERCDAMLATMDDITDVNFSDGCDEGNEKSVLDDEVVDLNTKSEWATFESNFDEQFVPLSKSEESPWESDAEGEGEGGEIGGQKNTVIRPPQNHEDQFDFVPFEKPAAVDGRRRDSQPLNTLDEPKFQRQSSSSSKHSDRSGGHSRPTGSGHGRRRPTTSDCSADSGKERPFSGSSTGRRYSRGNGESDEDWALAPPPSVSASARKIRSHRHYHEEEEPIRPRRGREVVEGDEANEEDDDRSHASYHSTSNSYSREKRRRYPHPSKYYDSRYPPSQSLQRHSGRRGRSARNGSPDRYSDHESDFDDSFEDEGVSRPKRDYLREEYWSAGSRPSSSGSGRRYPPVGRRDRSDFQNSSYHARDRESRYTHNHHNRHYRDRDRDPRERVRRERKDDDGNDENVSDFSEEDSGRWAAPGSGKKGRPRRTPHSQSHSHRGERDRERDSRHRYYYNSDSESPPSGPSEQVEKKSGNRKGSGGGGRPSSASHCHYNNSFVNTPPAEERANKSEGQGRGSSRYQSELALNTSRKLSASEFRFEDVDDFKTNDKPKSEMNDELSLPHEGRSGSSTRVSESNSSGTGVPGQRPPESPFEDNFVIPAVESSERDEPKLEFASSKVESERDVFFPTKFDFDSQTVEQMKVDDDNDLDNSLDVSEKSVESLQETPPSLEMKKSIESLEVEMKKSDSYNIFVREKDPFEDDDFFK